MTNANECTCPSGDGSLRHPCPAHPAPVEQVGTNVGHGHVFPRADGVKMRCGGPGLCSECAADASRARAALAQPSPTLPPFAEKVLAKLRRFYDCAEDFESGGVDIGRHWLDLLTQLGLLNRVQRSPALWEISQQGEDLLGTPHPSPAQAEKAEAERQEVVDFNPYRYHAEKIRQRADGAASAYEAGRSALGYMEDIAESALIVRNGLDELSAQHERITAKLHDALDESDGDRWKMRSERDAANARLHEVATACATAEQERDAALAEVERLRQFERICEGLPQDAIDGGWTVQGIRGYAKRLEDQLKSALARVAELEKQEPVGWANFRDGRFGAYLHRTEDDARRFDSTALAGKPAGSKQLALYAAPVAQAQQLHDLDKQCRDDVARALGLRPPQERGFAWSYLLASIKSCVKASEDAAQAQHSVPDGAADLCRFLAKLYCELDGLRYSTAKLPAEQIADALIFKWPVLQGARNQLNIKRISEQPYDESKLHSAIAAMLAAAPGKEVGHE